MTGMANLIPFLKLYRRDGDKGPVYLGRMNGLALRGFERQAETEGGNPYIELYVSISGSQENAGKKPLPRAPARDELQPLPRDRIARPDNTGREQGSMATDNTEPKQLGGQRVGGWGKRARPSNAPSPTPFHDDDISDIGAQP